MNEDRIIKLVVICVVCFVVFAVLQGTVNMATQKRCLRRGWPEAVVTWDFQRYCSKRVQQTDSIAPLRALEGSR